MRRRRLKTEKVSESNRTSSLNFTFLNMNWIVHLRWFIAVVFLTAIPTCRGVQVSVREDRKYALLFQTVVLPCQYSSISTQTPVVQWWYKSYCRDRTRQAFAYPDSHGASGGRGSFGGVEQGYASHLECPDSSRTVRIIASISGASITLSEHYKDRDISIINKADLRIGEVQWGDSGVYLCKVVIADDLEGLNEAPVELLVLERPWNYRSHDPQQQTITREALELQIP